MSSNSQERSGKIISLLLLAIAILGLPVFSTQAQGANSCLPLYKKQTVDPTGLVFDVEETDCDTIAKEEYAAVYVSKAGGGERSLLFKYDPEIQYRPKIKVVKKTIVISIDRISSIFYQARRWHDLSIQFQIGSIQYPSPLPGNALKPKSNKT